MRVIPVFLAGRVSVIKRAFRRLTAGNTYLGAQAPVYRTPIRMVEGHQCHRVAHAHRRLLVGKSFKAISPNGRFVEGAAAIDGQVLSQIQVHGKNLFYFFGSSEPVVMHIHFGMSGAFRTLSMPGPEPTATTRLVLSNEEMQLVAHLSAMTVQHGPSSFYHEKITKLGPDPLREDADKELLWAKVRTSKKPIGLVLMDQSMMAGVGNIYRAEVLFKAGVHPEQPAHTLSREAFDRVWYHSVVLLQRGFLSGSILTVDPEEAQVLGKPWTRRYIYNQKKCGRCGSAVRTWDMAARTVYACETCQPLTAGTELAAARAAAVAAATAATVFKSKCAPDDPGDVIPAKMTVAELRSKLLALNLDTRGKKALLVERVEAALKWLATAPADPAAATTADTATAITDAETRSSDLAEPAAVGSVADSAAQHVGPSTPVPVAARARPAAQHTSSPERTDAVGGPPTVSLELPVAHAPAGTKRRVRDQPESVARAAAVLDAARQLVEGPKEEEQEEEGGSSGDELDVAEALLSNSLSGPAAAASSSDLSKLTLAALKERARALSLVVSGTKAQLLSRLTAHATRSAAGGSSSAPAAAGPQSTADYDHSIYVNVRPGIQWLIEGDAQVASAKDAAIEKVVAGENRAVEHVALHDNEEEQVVAAAAAGELPDVLVPSAKRVRQLAVPAAPVTPAVQPVKKPRGGRKTATTAATSGQSRPAHTGTITAATAAAAEVPSNANRRSSRRRAVDAAETEAADNAPKKPRTDAASRQRVTNAAGRRRGGKQPLAAGPAPGDNMEQLEENIEQEQVVRRLF